MNENINLHNHLDYKQEYDKLQSLKSQLSEVESDVQGLLNGLVPPDVVTEKKAAVSALLQGESPDFSDTKDECRRNLESARKRKGVLLEAVRIQTAKVQSERMKASKKICDDLAPEYQKIIQEVAKKLIELGKVVLTEKQFRNDLVENDVALGSFIHPVPVNLFGHPWDPDSRISLWLQEAVSHGYADESIIPALWRKKWKKDFNENY